MRLEGIDFRSFGVHRLSVDVISTSDGAPEHLFASGTLLAAPRHPRLLHLLNAHHLLEQQHNDDAVTKVEWRKDVTGIVYSGCRLGARPGVGLGLGVGRLVKVRLGDIVVVAVCRRTGRRRSHTISTWFECILARG